MSLTPEQRSRLIEACKLWLGTPYLAGQCIPGKEGGVDCVRLTDAILQQTYGLSLEPLPRHAQDAAFHNKEVVQSMVRLFFERFDLFTVNNPRVFLPTDLIMTRQITNGEMPETPSGHHVILVTARKPVCIDAWPRIGVREIGLGGVKASFTILKVYRTRMAYAEA